jgi:hypothetical protein
MKALGGRGVGCDPEWRLPGGQRFEMGAETDAVRKSE